MLLQNEWQGYKAPAALSNIEMTMRKLFPGSVKIRHPQ